MQIEFHGTGRAAGALALSAVRCGHAITSVVGRSPERVRAIETRVDPTGGSPDLRVLAVSDDAIAEVALGLADAPPVPTVHVSGSVPVAALAPLGSVPVGSFHPLQTLPDADTGADHLPGSWIAVTADEPFASQLDAFARSLECVPFRLADADKALYHAAAAASANFTLASLGVADRLFSAAGVPFDAARPLVEAIVANAFELGPGASLTGPIARGDTGTVRRQLDAVATVSPEVLDSFRALATGTAIFADASDEIREMLR